MEEISKIISAISQVTGLDQFSIKFGKTIDSKQAREILCYIALKDNYGLTWILMEFLQKKRSQVLFMASACMEKMEEDVYYLMIMNRVRNVLGIVPLMKDREMELQYSQRRKEKIEKEEEMKKVVKTVFGMEYSEKDKRDMKKAMKSACEYMADYCRTGLNCN